MPKIDIYQGNEGNELAELIEKSNDWDKLLEVQDEKLNVKADDTFTIPNVKSVKVLDKNEKYAILIDGPYEEAIRLVKDIQMWLEDDKTPLAFIYVGDATDIEFKPMDKALEILAQENS